MGALRDRAVEPAGVQRAVVGGAPAAGGDVVGGGVGPAGDGAGVAAHRAGAGPGGAGGAGGAGHRRRDARGDGAAAPEVAGAGGEGRPCGVDPRGPCDDVRAVQADQRVPHDLSGVGGGAGGPRPVASCGGGLGGPGEHRRPDGPAEPAAPRRVPVRCGGGRDDRGARPRRVQGGQRHARPPGGGRDPPKGGGAAVECGAFGGPVGAHGRRRVHPGAAGRHGVRRGRGLRAHPGGGGGRAVGVLGAGHAGGRVDRVGAPVGRGEPGADAMGRRPGDVSDETFEEAPLDRRRFNAALRGRARRARRGRCRRPLRRSPPRGSAGRPRPARRGRRCSRRRG